MFVLYVAHKARIPNLAPKKDDTRAYADVYEDALASMVVVKKIGLLLL